MRQMYNFATAIEALKKLERFRGQYYWKDYPERKRYESVAEHSWRLGVLVMMFASQLKKKINLEKALKMALIHDLPEIIAGDASPLGKDGTGKMTHAFDEAARLRKHEKEKRAAVALFGKLPTKIGAEFLKLWLEIEAHKTFEARVVKSLDKLECMLQVQEYRRGHLFSEHWHFTITYGMKGSEVDPVIAEFGSLIVKSMRKTFRPYHIKK